MCLAQVPQDFEGQREGQGHDRENAYVVSPSDIYKTRLNRRSPEVMNGYTDGEEWSEDSMKTRRAGDSGTLKRRSAYGGGGNVIVR